MITLICYFKNNVVVYNKIYATLHHNDLYSRSLNCAHGGSIVVYNVLIYCQITLYTMINH